MVDDPTLSAINGVRDDVRALRTDLTARMDNMVTRREHEAEIRRLDEANLHAAQALANHETWAGQRLQEISSEQSQIMAQMEAVEAKREAAQSAAAERRRKDRQFIATWVTGAVGVGITLASLITRWIGG